MASAKQPLEPGTLLLPAYPLLALFEPGQYRISRVTPVSTCYVRRPRWLQALAFCVLEAAAFRPVGVRQLSAPQAHYPNDHNYTIFPGSVDNLYTRFALDPYTLLPVTHLGFTTNLLAKLWFGRT